MRRLVAFGALAVALAACGSPQQAGLPSSIVVEPTVSSEVAPVPPSSAPLTSGQVSAPGSGRCTAAVLAGVVESTEAGAGNRYGKLVVTNNGSVPCTVNGYSGLQLQDAAGNPLPTDLRRTPDPGPSPVTLAPGTAAAANLHWTVVPTGDEPVDRPCQVEAAKAAAIPPDETEPMSLRWGLGPVCAGGKIEISAFYAA
ncbi:peptidase C14, caspase catalytic subunit P20 [Saccharothrix sp. NRRL B-16348]|uniref:DUF4232 domain-containing protein n=1 Tax=Saccharothrix sp. NRRL B-16348 TaxID=1415542 RepID=UPI0006AD854F|nr:DUF4232 domain-containing protein [Saccharothrix sp. NRRL B-16348]KOX22658.1 peptidase C14, caspase catalytic subunit P20 [Saccharothrix sp. NRRL B-16348]